MSQEEDVMFCRIAIQNGLVTEANAQKALALCDKRQKEDGERPQIGAVFTKYNLMGIQEVKRVYEAVRKRSGGGAAVAAPTRRPGPGVRTRRRAAAGGRAMREAAVEREGGGGIDQQTLLLGIGGMVALLVIGGVLLWLVLRDRVGSHDAHKTSTPTETEAQIAEKEKQAIAGAKGAAAKPAAPPKAAAPTEREMPRDELNDLNTLIGEVRKEQQDDPKVALDKLLSREKEIERRGYKKPVNLTAAITEIRDAMAQGGAGASGESKSESKAESAPAPETPKAEEAKPEEAKAPPPAEKKEEPVEDELKE